MLNKNALSIATLCDREVSRFTLQAILVTPTHTIVTDGHQVTMVSLPKFSVESFPQCEGMPIPTRDFKPFLIPREMALEIEKALPEKATIPILKCAAITVDDEGLPTIWVTDLENTRTWKPRMQGNFPDVGRVIPKKEDAEFQIALGVDLIKRIVSEIKAFGNKARGQTGVYSFYGPNDAARIDCELDGQSLTTVFMPMRGFDVPGIFEQRKKVDAAAHEFFMNVGSHRNGSESETGILPDEWILAHGAALYGQLLEIYQPKEPVSKIVEMPRREGPVEQVSPNAASVVTTCDQDSAEVEPVKDFGRDFFRMAGDYVYDGNGNQIAKLPDGKTLGIAKSFDGDREALRVFVKGELAKREACIAAQRITPELPKPVPADRPANWNELSAAEKAWVTRRHGKGPAAQKKVSLNQGLADVAALLKQALAQVQSPSQEVQ